MKTLRIVILSLCAAFLLAACGSNTPEAVFEKYVDAAKAVDFDAAKKCISKSLFQEFDEMMKTTTEDDIKEMKKENESMVIKVIRSEINGDNAIVYYEEGHGDHSHENQVPLVKEDGEWKITHL